MRLPLRSVCGMLTILLIGAKAHAQISGPTECYDAEVSGRIVNQTPSIPPAGSIVMRWPWFIDLEIRHVREGAIRRGRVTVLSIQHTYMRPNLVRKQWLLRRNSLGGFNLLESANETKLPRCSENVPPAMAYITPDVGGTLDELRRAGAERYGNGP